MKLRILFSVAVAFLFCSEVLQAAEVIATGLNNPRGIAVGPEGSLYVAEAGKGGSGPCLAGERGTVCAGTTGSITRIDLRKGTLERIVSGLPSLAAPDGTEAIGAHDVSFQGRGNGYFTIGLGQDPAVRAIFGSIGVNLAHTARFQPNGKWSPETDLGIYEQQNNPAGGPIDTDPFGILALPGKVIVADAGGNDLIEIAANGTIRTLATFANRLVPAPPFLGLPAGAMIPMEPVPTTVIQGNDGNYYVGQLTGFPFPPGAASIYRVPADGGAPVAVLTGFTNIIDIAAGPDGSLYVLEISKNGLLSGNGVGALIRVAPNGTRTELVPGELFFPGGLVFGPDGALYVTTGAILPGGGSVVRIVP
jgi:hypothetical protein